VDVTGVSDGDMDCTFTNLEHTSEGWIRVGAIQSDNDGLSGQFTLLNVDLEPVSSNTQCNLTLSVTTFKDSTPECTSMSYNISNGLYTSSKNGDSNGDAVVDIADAAYIAKHVIGIAGYESIDEGAADVNGDGVVDMSDAMYLTKHVIGITGYEELL
ncbi:MAG: dockerin type I repeat-containing protein, partial [Chloroflexota bacterium]|nr:dockerin type I repeat-containing protein [Chloroflexota bacterium]